jgi:hypothetical protein
MLRTVIGVLAAAITATALSALPADAAKKGKKRYPAPHTSIGISGPSLDGRTTGRPRTCGFDSYQYDGWGVPVGPYCH